MENIENAVEMNREGAPTYRRSLEEQVLQVLTTNCLGNTFYVNKQDMTAETLGVLYQAVAECPEFLAKALVYSRNKALLKLVPTIGLVVLSGARDKTLFQRVFDRVVLIPDDLRNFVQWCLSGRIRGRKSFGGCVVDPVANWLNTMSEYHAIKYGSAQSKDITLRDIIRLAHPRPNSPAVSERFGWLLSGWKQIGPDPSPTNPSIWALEALKRAIDEEEIIRLITEYKLPFEVVIPSLRSTSTKVWETLMQSAPYFNLLRNLNTFERHGVFGEPSNVEAATKRLTDPKSVERSKLLPFRFFAAFQAFTAQVGHRQAIADAISEALQLSFVNLPDFPKGTLAAVGVDVSGSMSDGMATSEHSATRYIDIASIFAAAVLKKASKETLLLPFDNQLHTVKFASSDSLMTIARQIASIGHGGTSLGLPIEYLLRNELPVDVFIGFTDCEDWAYGHGYSCSNSFLGLWRQYRQQVNGEAQAFLVTLAPYRDAPAPQGEPGVHFIYGWSEAVIGYIPLMLQFGLGQLDVVKAITL